jgi:hypothetical protein
MVRDQKLSPLQNHYQLQMLCLFVQNATKQQELAMELKEIKKYGFVKNARVAFKKQNIWQI